MIRLISFLMCMFMVGCKISPQVIPGNTQDSAMTLNLKKQVLDGNQSGGCGWLFWYIPILFIVCGWTYREFFVKRTKQKDFQ